LIAAARMQQIIDTESKLLSQLTDCWSIRAGSLICTKEILA
jgi:hypothetical protein